MEVLPPIKDESDRLARSDCRSSPARSCRQDQDAVSDTSSAQSVEIPERRDGDIVGQWSSTRSEEYRLLFRLPHGEVLLQDFNCALQDNILLQGHIYLFIHHICFYSNIFGYETKRTISYYDVTDVRKAKTAAIFPNAIEIMTVERKHFFGSFLSRDEAYRFIVKAWQQHINNAGVFSDSQESKSEIDIPENAATILELENEVLSQMGCSNFVNSVVMNSLEIHENGVQNGCTRSGEGWSWQPEDADAPKVPDYYTKVAEGTFPVRVEEFFYLFFSDDAIDFLEKFHQACGDKDFKCSRWHQNAEFVHARDLSFQHPIKIYYGAKFGQCHTIQKFRIYRNSHLLIEVSQQVRDVPYGDYFHVQVLWDVEKDVNSEPGCLLRVYINVVFSRKTMWKGKIEQSTIDECREVYGNWIVYAHKLLKEKNVEESEGGIMSISHVQDVELESSSKPDHPENIIITHPSAAVLETSPAASMETPPLQNSSPVENPELINSVINLFKGCWTNLLSNAPMLIVLFLGLLLLIQASIIVLLVRTPEIRVISPANHMSGSVYEKTEALDWLEKQVCLLSEEMGIMETRMERMRREYAILKEHLERLQRLKRKP